MEIPIEVVIDHILPYCPVKDFVNLLATCKSYQKLYLWRYLLERDYKPDYDLPPNYVNTFSLYKHLHSVHHELIFDGKICKILVRNPKLMSDETEEKIYGLSRPDVGYIVQNKIDYDYPLAEELLEVWFRQGKIEHKCRSTQNCRRLDCSLVMFREITGE